MAVKHTLEKYTGESRLYNFDFSDEAEVVAGGTISAPVVTASGTGLTIGTPTFAAAIVQVRLSSGTPGTDYTMVCTVAVTGGNTLVREGILRVLAP
jgi:hypothetical protein